MLLASSALLVFNFARGGDGAILGGDGRGKVNQNGDKGGREGAVIQKARQCSGPLDQVIQGAVLPFLFNY